MIRKIQGEPPRCVVCGELIPRKEGQEHYVWMKRKVCSMDTDTKPIKCLTVNASSNGKLHKGEKYKKEHNPVAAKPAEVKKPKLTEAQKAEMERQQREIDRAVFTIGIENYTTFPAVSLPPEEIKRLGSIYQPPTGPQRHILPHFQMRTTI